ncbi:ketoacyl-synt-domain-containing protein [Penicillium angulare]|uniref:ketoacyl-synt-domain-containing protein n=1 Tax=Penicillium angulare TaxID=116970 RepID=UPI00253F84C7|nr:ketoacyl-synt-domain-containing protein [Penicillium angulare]KAJ5287210.1 ketoacyl-synt-domain-containing protein [Penicillium angulare]
MNTLKDTIQPVSTKIFPSSIATTESKNNGSYAIIGMGGRFPGGDDLDSFWNALEEGLDLHQPVPISRFDPETHYDKTGKIPNTTLTPYGCFLDHPDLFDARLFNMSPKEAAATDPGQRLLLMTTYEALQMAGYPHNKAMSTHGHRVGTFIGQTSDDYREVNEGQEIGIFWTPGGMRAFGPGRLNYYFGWDGPSYSIDAACSSSMAAIQVALTTLKNKECDMAVAGGVNIITSSDPYAGLSRGGFLSLTGSCKTWDANADGYCRGEGVGVVVIKRLEDAIASRDPIQCVIRGISTNHSAQAISITHPHAATQVKLFSAVLNDAGVKPNEVDYVEMHGTGTQAGDSIETAAMAEAMSARSSGDRPMYIGTVKPNIGHGESASGVASIMKSVLMFKKSIIPPHIGIKGTINPSIPTQKLDSLNIQIPRTKVPFCNGEKPRRILVNNFNAAGGNTSLLLEDYVIDQQGREDTQDPRPYHVVAVSAKTKSSLQMNVNRLTTLLKTKDDIRLADLAYSLTARQIHHPLRQVYTATDMPQLIANLEQGLSKAIEPPKIRPRPIFLFSGQGSLYPGMGSQLYATCNVFADKIREIDEICHSLGLPPILQTFENALFDPTNASSLQGQLTIVAVGIALATLWRSWGVEPQLVCGHSLGEYAALCISGVLSLHDTFYLLGERGKLIEKFCQRGTHAMLAVSMPPDRLEQILSGEEFAACEIACCNGPGSTVVSGAVESITALDSSLRNIHCVRAQYLDLPYAFHSAQLDPCLEPFIAMARKVRFHKPNIPVASTCEGNIVTDTGIFGAEYLGRQARQPVLFQETVETILSTGGFEVDSTFWIDIGARPLCLNMAKSILAGRCANIYPSITSKEDNWLTLSKSVSSIYRGGIDIDWSTFHREYESTLQFVTLPSYAFDLKSHWLQYEGDWLITKSGCENKPRPSSQQQTFSPTATLHRIEREEFKDEGSNVTFVSDLNEEHLSAIISGHLVNKVALCPSSVYGDMAFTAASYIWERINSDDIPAMDLADIEVHKPLILAGKGEQLVFITASKESKSSSVSITISSKGNGTTHSETVHVTCSVHYGNSKEWMSQWTKQQYLIQGRIDSLKQASLEGKIHRLKRGMAYKLFGSFVEYSKQFQGMDDIHMDSEILEGSAQICFQPMPAGERSRYPPYWIDSLVHLSGFILNVSETIPDDVVYISHGWGSMRIASSLSENGNYRAYVRMQESEKNIMSGDVYVLDQDQNRTIAVVEDVKFQAIKKKILSLLLPSPGTETRSMLSEAAPSHHKKLNKSVSGHHKDPQVSKDIFSGVLDLIADETGVLPEELTDGTDLEEIGLDSLISLAIVDKLRQDLHMNVPSSLFLTCRRIADLRTYFQSPDMHDFESSTSHASSELGEESCSGSGYSTPSTTATSEPADSLLQALPGIIASESGVDVEEVISGTTFAHLGIDSLLGLSIIDTVYTQTGRRLPSSFFLDHSTYADVERSLGPIHPTTSSPALRGINDGDTLSDLDALPYCNSVLLQGDPLVEGPSLFLLSDGSGSAGSYAGLPCLAGNLPGESKNVKVWGLNSPFLGCSEPFDISFRDMAGMYVDEILRIDPEGPYILGGWSIGGIFAFEATRILRQANKHVEGLVLIDSPCPGVVPPLSPHTIDILDDLGLTKSQISQKRQKSTHAHFIGSIRTLGAYVPEPMMGSQALNCLAVWAKSGVWESVEDHKRKQAMYKIPENESHQWIMDERAKPMGPSGWETLLPKVEVEVIAGDHFSIMKRPQISQLADVISRYICH